MWFTVLSLCWACSETRVHWSCIQAQLVMSWLLWYSLTWFSVSNRWSVVCYDASLTQGSFTAVKIHCNVTMNLLSLRLSWLCEFVACSREQGSDSREQHTEPNTPCSVLVLAFRHPRLYFTHPPSLYNNSTIYLRLQSTEDTAQGLCLCVYCH